ncbi:MAG: hypothetical protein JRH18_01075 [Deltaproteobacteria bacterium]|nr:hypothetical protein [Deltaproteobacteria bacterium]MBW1995364.1 hypothetical protein [Deltaproteobacteria bacterium]MBW2150240.1 hypothetical protein [Deltaproteobacteria bacterium]
MDKWARHSEFIEFSDSPWHELSIEISECRLALITTGGVHLKSQPAFDMEDPAGDPTFREIPADTRPSNLTITHDYYDHSDADKDINVVFPIERVHSLKRLGKIGEVNHRHFSFMGHLRHPNIRHLVANSVKRVVNHLRKDRVDIAILTPA